MDMWPEDPADHPPVSPRRLDGDTVYALARFTHHSVHDDRKRVEPMLVPKAALVPAE